MTPTPTQADAALEAITDVEAVDRFIAAVPDLWDPDDAGEPQWYGFRADGGLDVINAFAPGAERAEAMDLRANWVIGYVKTYRPVALVMVSEMFMRREVVGEPSADREPVDCDRFNVDAAYRADVLTRRREVLGVFAETATGMRQVFWPIVREGATRRLGRREVPSIGRMGGRFTALLRKAHAHDELVHPVSDQVQAKKPFAPESIEALRVRFGPGPKPVPRGLTVQAVDACTFDGRDLRLIVYVVEGEGVSVIAMNFGEAAPTSEFLARALNLFSEISGRTATPQDVIKKLDGGVGEGVLAVLLPA